MLLAISFMIKFLQFKRIKFNKHLNELIVLLFSVIESKRSFFLSYDVNTTSQMLPLF
jgi:hypothetical protein